MTLKIKTENDPTEDFERLQAFVVSNPDLEKLESLLDEFNLFEAIGAVRQEVRHSDFLAYLLNPRQNHGLGDTFVKRFLQKAILLANQPQSITPIDLDLWDLDEIDVRREWQNIDILLLDETQEHRFAVIIENKVLSGEHSNQLQRYRKIIQQHYPGVRLLCLFLTPDGGEPSDPSYIPISYDLVCRLIEELTEMRASTLGPDIQVMMRHYTRMIRRYIMENEELAELCKKIYKRHQRALDLIYEYRPDQQAEIRELLDTLIKSCPECELDTSSKTYIR